MQWDAATDNVGVTDYTVYRDAVAVGSTSGLTYTDTGLTANTSYDFHVTASDAAANESGPSNVLTVVTDAVPPGGSSTVSFQDGVSPSAAYVGTRDVYISQNAPTANSGTSAELLLDGDDPPGSGNDLSTLLKWDIAQIPAGSIVESAQIDIEVFNRSTGIYELFELKRDWVESQASWNAYSSGNSWQTGGAQGTNDRGTTAVGSIAASVTGPHSVVLNAAGIALLQTWVDDPASNYGLIATGSDVTDGLDARSSEYGTATQRPKLTITYSAPSGDTENPTAPTNLQETDRTTTTASLSWTASTDNVGVTEYAVYRDGVEVGTTGGTSFTDTGLAPSTSYSYHATARDAAGNESGPSGVVVILTDPATNTSPAVSISSPANGSVVTEGTSISFAGTASDVEEGDLTAGLSWTSNIDGPIGSGGSFSAVLSLGSHVVTAMVTDSGGAPGSDVVTVIVDVAGSTPQFDGAMAWPLCGRIDEAPPAGWSDADGCPTERWGDAAFSDLPIHSPFGPRRLASENGRYDFHRGIDLATPTGTPIFAVTDGIVRISGTHPSYSDPLVQLRHFRPGETSCNAGGCYHSNYLHLSQTVVAEDDVVSKGDLLGYTGASASGFEHLHFEIRDAPASDPFSIWQRDTIDALGVLPYEEPSGAAIIFNSVDTSSPSEPVVSLTVQTAHVDVQRVELTLTDSVGAVLPQPGNTPDARGYNVNPSWFGMNEWNRQYTHKDSTNVPWESFGAGGVNECPYHPDHPAGYDAHVHMDQQSPGDFQVGLFNGIEVSRPPISGGIYSLHLTFHELVGAADCYTAEVFFSAGGSATEHWGACPGSGNVAPVVSITSPANGSSVTEGSSISFAGTANDAEDGDLTASLSWSSDIDGSIGTGAGFSTVLSVGTHNITASVTDSGGQPGSDVISITVAANVAPIVSITSPAADGDSQHHRIRYRCRWSARLRRSQCHGGSEHSAGRFDYTADGSSTEGSSVSFSGTAVDAENGDLTAGLSWVSDLDGAIGGGGSFSTPLSVGTHLVTASVTDSGGLQGFAAITVTIDATPPAGLTIEQVVVSNVTNTAWTTVPLASTYDEMVVVCSPNYDSASAPLVPRVTNAIGNSFDLRVDRADGSAAAVAGVSVHCVAVEEGVYNETDHGVTMEAVKYTSTVTDGKGSWNGEARAYANAYSTPVVVGQVMTYNDVRHSVFWTRGSSSKAPPSSSALRVGKHVGEDSNSGRADETIGYIVVEAGNGVVGGVSYEAGLGADSVRGVANSPPYNYALSGSLSTVSAGIVSQAGMDGGDGSWAVLYGVNPATPSSLSLAADEDQMKDTERKHTTEQVGYLVFE